MRTLASPWILSCSLGARVPPRLGLAFLAVCHARVKGCRVSPGCGVPKLRALGKSVGSRTHPVSSWATLAKCTRRVCIVGITLCNNLACNFKQVACF